METLVVTMRHLLLLGGLLGILFIASVDLKFDDCQFQQVQFNPEFEVQTFGKPTAFVTTKSVGLSPYSLIDPFRQSALFHEYLLIGPGIANYDVRLLQSPEKEQKEEEEEIQLLLYDQDEVMEWENDPDLVQQNLGKENLWALINATGMLPSMTIVNTTFEKTFRFHADGSDKVAYHLAYPNLFRSRETVPPMDVIIEFPAKTRMLLAVKTMIDYQTFGLLRWKLTPADPISWEQYASQDSGWEHPVKVENESLCAFPSGDVKSMNSLSYLRCVYSRRYKRLENPCIKDMIILYVIVGVRGVPNDDQSYFAVNKLLMIIPMVSELLNYGGWLDLTEAYCPRPDLSEECGNPVDVVLTNDHLLILTDRGLWVSNSMNGSNVNVSYPYSMKPLMKFTPIDPCAQFDNFNCSEVGTPVLARQSVRRQRLFYTPVCHLYQYPVYEDMVMLAIDHVSQTDDMREERDVFTVLYAAKPYNDWKILFHGKYEYAKTLEDVQIAELVSMFFNHHRRHFDITLKLMNHDGVEELVRFALPLPTSSDFKGYEKLSGLLGNGFLEFTFPRTFYMTQIFVNPEPMDVFFVGNQIWIAEAAGAFVYVSVPHVSSDIEDSDGIISHCSFNHPDRVFVYLNELRFIMLYNLWPMTYLRYISLYGHFVASYSGKVMLWYLDRHNNLVHAQMTHLDQYNSGNSSCTQGQNEFRPVMCHVCERLISRVVTSGCTLNYQHEIPRFKMLSIHSTDLHGRDAVTDGPLVPFLTDGDRVVIFEVNVPNLQNHKPMRDYFLPVDVGHTISCTDRQPEQLLADNSTTSTNSSTSPRDPPSDDWECPPMTREGARDKCELYIRHTKHLLRHGQEAFLKGYRRVLFATVIDSFPLRPIPTDMVVLVLPNSNKVIIQLSTLMFETEKEYTFTYADVGQTLYIPEHFSVFLQGFPRFKSCHSEKDMLQHDMTRMVGLATRNYRQGTNFTLRPFKAFLVDFNTPAYCDYHRRTLHDLNKTACVDDPYPSDVISEEYRKRREEMDIKRNKDHEYHSRLFQSLNTYYSDSLNSIESGGPNNSVTFFPPLRQLTPTRYHDAEDAILNDVVPAVGELGARKMEMNHTQNPLHFSPSHYLESRQCRPTGWKIEGRGCHLQLYLDKNPVLKQSGGRISLDKHDYLSLQMKLKALTPLGRSMIHRPLIAVTNSNPQVLTVEQHETRANDIQIMNITLYPVGFTTGVATLSIRPLIVSSACKFAEGSFTLIVQVHRAQGRRLHINYPIPMCKPGPEDGEYERPWKEDLPICVTRQELLTLREVIRPNAEVGTVFYSELPVNYRPPSHQGSEIPLSKYMYNVDPAKPNFREKYRISRETRDLNRCEGKLTKEECECNANDILSPDLMYTDCTRMAYTAKRGFRVDISVEYDRIMRDTDQDLVIFTPKRNWSVYLEEINSRVEYTASSANSPYLELINKRQSLNQGRKLYDAQTLAVTLHGTGLFHFKVALGSFESFGEVSGYFMIYVPDNELNHVQLVVIMLLTITICMVFVFCGFLLVRQRLCSQLPFQTQHIEKQKLE